MNQEESQMHENVREKELLKQLAGLLVKENLLSREEQLRFLSVLKEE